MFRLGSNNTKRPMTQVKRDTLETESSTFDGGLSSFAKDTVNKVGQNFSDIGKGMKIHKHKNKSKNKKLKLLNWKIKRSSVSKTWKQDVKLNK
jgi:hypothetical protein